MASEPDPERRLPPELERYLERPLTDEERERLLATFEAERRYRPIHPEPAWRAALRRLWAFILAAVGFVAKFGAVIFKVPFLFSIFVTIGLYAAAWGWQFAVGLVGLVFVHELGHVIESRRQGLRVTAPRFIPFFGAYVVHERPANAFRGALIALAGPAIGGLGAAACWWLGEAQDSNALRAIAYTGFFLNLINLLPVGILDGGRVIDVVNPLLLAIGALGLAAVAWRSHNGLLVIVLIAVAGYLVWRWQTRQRRGDDPYYRVEDWQPGVITVLYGAIAALLILGMVASQVPRPQ